VRAAFEVADVLKLVHDDLPMSGFNTWQLRTLYAIGKCRTSALGGHIDLCTACGVLSMSYNSCRNRHCPKCQGKEREKWIKAREDELLPVPYFHVVFTLPSQINRLCLYEPAKVYNLLFDTAWSVLQSFASDEKHLGAKSGMIAILHTWGQTMSLHPHLHCIVPSGGVTKREYWKSCRNKGKYLYPEFAVGSVFRSRYVSGLRKLFPNESKSFFNSLFDKPWIVHAKEPFKTPHTVVEYLGRYTHKIAISNHRIKSVTPTEVRFSYKDYADSNKQKEMSLSPDEFIRRFAQHILPKRFVRIRHYGILSSTWKRKKLRDLQEQMGVDKLLESKNVNGSQFRICPYCNAPAVITILTFDDRGPPIQYQSLISSDNHRIRYPSKIRKYEAVV
jgi:hypothetical protein